MKTNNISFIAICLFAICACAPQRPAAQAATVTPKCDNKISDFPNFSFYEAKNKSLDKYDPHRVVFMGDSITQFWDAKQEAIFKNPHLINRGISGQPTEQMLLRFRQDVIALKPKIVVINGGTNDLAGNTGPKPDEVIIGNIKSMAELARTHGIKVVLSTILPADHFNWSPGILPADRIKAINSQLKQYAKQNGYGFIDYYSALVDEKSALPPKYSNDGVHPNETGYAVMQPLALKEIKKLK